LQLEFKGKNFFYRL